MKKIKNSSEKKMKCSRTAYEGRDELIASQGLPSALQGQAQTHQHSGGMYQGHALCMAGLGFSLCLFGPFTYCEQECKRWCWMGARQSLPGGGLSAAVVSSLVSPKQTCCAKHPRQHPMHIPTVTFAMQDFNTALGLSEQRKAMLQPQLFLQCRVVFLPQRATYKKSPPFHQCQALSLCTCLTKSKLGALPRSQTPPEMHFTPYAQKYFFYLPSWISSGIS